MCEEFGIYCVVDVECTWSNGTRKVMTEIVYRSHHSSIEPLLDRQLVEFFRKTPNVVVEVEPVCLRACLFL